TQEENASLLKEFEVFKAKSKAWAFEDGIEKAEQELAQQVLLSRWGVVPKQGTRCGSSLTIIHVEQ
ncbi:unnamed protein product, partial [Ilex paraguariensis]